MYNYNMAIQVKLKKWGNSLGIIIPSETLKKKKLKEGEEVIVEIEKKGLEGVFASLKDWKIDSQKLKDEIRKREWEDE